MGVEFHPVMSGAESLFFEGNTIGILLCHGFNGTPQSMQYIGEELSRYGYTVSIPRLTGHGTHYSDMENSTYKRWISDLQSAYGELKKQCVKIFVVGQSMGGALTIQLAATNKEVDGIFLINAAVTDVSYEEYRDKQEPIFISEGTPDIKKASVYEITYDKVPLKAVHQLLELMRDTKRKVSQVNTPVTILKSKIDHVVPPVNSEFIYNHVNSRYKKLITLENSYHVASMDNDAPAIVDNIHNQIVELTTNDLVLNYS